LDVSELHYRGAPMQLEQNRRHSPMELKLNVAIMNVMADTWTHSEKKADNERQERKLDKFCTRYNGQTNNIKQSQHSTLAQPHSLTSNRICVSDVRAASKYPCFHSHSHSPAHPSWPWVTPSSVESGSSVCALAVVCAEHWHSHWYWH